MDHGPVRRICESVIDFFAGDGTQQNHASTSTRLKSDATQGAQGSSDLEATKSDSAATTKTDASSAAHVNKNESSHQRPRQPLKMLKTGTVHRQKSSTDYKHAHEALSTKYTNLEQAYEDAKTKIAQLKEEIEKLKCDNEESINHQKSTASRYNYIIKKCLGPNVKHLDTQYDDKSKEAIDALIEPLLEAAREAPSLNNQVQLLQKEMLKKVEKVEAIPDEVFAKDFRALTSSIKTFSRTMLSTSDIDLRQVTPLPLLLYNVEINLLENRTMKKYFMEAFIWSKLIYTVFFNPFKLFGKQFESTLWMWQTIFGQGQQYIWPPPSAYSETWRYTTAKNLVETIGMDNVFASMLQEAHDKPGSTIYHHDAIAVIQARRMVVNIIGSGLSLISSNFDDVKLCDIVDMAFDLSIQMSLQRCRIQLTFPMIGARFNELQMSALPNYDEDDEITDESFVTFVVNPGLTKYGDALGKDLDQRYNIVPALVQHEPRHTETETVKNLG